MLIIFQLNGNKNLGPEANKVKMIADYKKPLEGTCIF